MATVNEDRIDLEKLKRKRKLVRCNTTKYVNDINDLLTSGISDIERKVKLDNLGKMEFSLNTLNESIMEIFLELAISDEICVEEMNKCVKYQEEIAKCRYKLVEKAKSRNYQNSSQHSTLSVRLPKLTLESFDLNPSNWTNFWTQFKGIDDNTELCNEDKMRYLRMCLKGQAKNIIDSYPNTSENYIKAMEHLKQRFGREDLIINCMYKELLQCVKLNVGIVELYDSVSSKIRTLETYGITSEKSSLLVPLIEECLPVEMLKHWERSRDIEDRNASEKMEKLLRFLKNEADAESRLNGTRGSNENYSAAALVTTYKTNSDNDFKRNKVNEPLRIVCIFCGQSHYSQDCKNGMSTCERRKVAESKRVCFQCLRPNHSRKNCRRRISCRRCQGRHFEIMCIGPISERKQESSTSTTACASSTLFAGNGGQVLMKTLLCFIGNLKVKILLDSASHRSYVTNRIVQKLNLTGVGTESMKHMLFGGQTSAQTLHTLYEIELMSFDRKNKFTVTALNQEQICGRIPAVDSNIIKRMREINVWLADDGVERPIDLLLGADAMGSLVTGMKYIDNKLVAFETVLGWCLLGTVPMDQSPSMANFVCNLVSHPASLWELDVLGIESQSSKNIAECHDNVVKHFKENIEFENMYRVALPWKEGHPPIPTNRDVALARLQSVVRRLERNNLYDLYDDVFRSWESEGFIEQVSEEDTGHFLCHRPVIKEGKTTKIRPVFDASCKSFGEISLNECLETGPNMIAELVPLLLRFRSGEVGVTGDIKQAFLRIGLKNISDREMLKFLWFREGKLIVMRHSRNVFGVTCSPFILNATIQHHLNNYDFDLIVSPKVKEKLKCSFYMDDCINSFIDRKSAQDFVNIATKVMAAANFELRGWVVSGDNVNTQVLGVKWNASQDSLGCQPLSRYEGILTKKKLLSIINKIYDPLGILAAPLLYMKLALQEVFKLKLGWDELIPTAIELKCSRWLSEIDLINQIEIPRCIMKNTATLHAFSDASGRGFGVCIFARYVENGEVNIRFVAAKARVAPVEDMSIPRKELVAALLSSRLGCTVQKNINNNNIVYWTDSMTVLYWIKKGEWRTFVGNRVNEIRRLTEPIQWRFVPGEMNCADVVSRGCFLSEYISMQWLEGPAWLKENEEFWPKTDIVPTQLEAVPVLCNLHNSSIDLSMYCLSPYFSKNVRVLCYVLRFIDCCRSKSKNVVKDIKLSLEEKQVAERRIVCYLQGLLSNETYKFNTFIDVNGIIRVRTKILSDQFLAEFKEPILLPRCKLVESLIRETHERNHHAGASVVLGLLREKYWIIKGRRLARFVINRCVKCRRFKAKPVSPPPVGLPNNRVELGKVFAVCGCDLTGPLFVKGNSKVWIVLFTCAVYRAVHLELVESLSTDAFVMAFRRFVARRGRVCKMYSDNGTNFVGLANLIKESCIEDKFNLKWIFNAPTAAWWGGFFERLFGVMKGILRVTLGRALLNITELNTVLTEVEALINARPITYESESPSELIPISPSMFLTESSCELPELDKVDNRGLCYRVKYVAEVRANIKERFRKEYLGNLLLMRGKEINNVKIGEIYLIHSDAKKRIEWQLGLVIEVYPGKDGVVRVVKLKTKNGELIRPVQRLYPMEVGNANLNVLDNSVEVDLTNDGNEEIVTRTKSGRNVKKPKVLDL